MNCPFCNLEHSEVNRVLEERTHTVVIFSNPRLMPGHLLVIPKRHVLSLSELSAEERSELFDIAIEYQDKILERISSGCDLKQHNRPFIPQNDLKIDHVHLHLQPREWEDELYSKSQVHDRALFQKLPQEEADRIAALLA